MKIEDGYIYSKDQQTRMFHDGHGLRAQKFVKKTQAYGAPGAPGHAYEVFASARFGISAGLGIVLNIVEEQLRDAAARA